ncbi:DegT/DnrJ/EryC1/StrS family aminotransferase, partial [Candidatus Woesebacteria bacterium]|nr:DegT/DnrJ/EryC1/StrS family aminotransferase [Candidatus Woesebacteria bacterium]
FTCIAVCNSITWNKAKPIYVDIGDDLNIDPDDLEKKITKNSKAIIMQHTFGIPAEVEKIKTIAKKKGLVIIEDCAHALGAAYKNKPLGTFSKVSFFSFGRDKALSSVFGGMILTRDKLLYEKLKKLRDKLDHPSNFWIFQQLMHPLLMSFVKPTYNLGFGKITLGKMLLFISQKMKLLSFPVYEDEKKGIRPGIFPAKIPGALAILATNQLKKLERFVGHRREIAKVYRDKLKSTGFRIIKLKEGESLLRFPVLTPDAQNIHESMKSEGILLGNWYNCPIVPCADESVTRYVNGSCKNTEDLSSQILNLPTYIGITKKDAEEISELVKKWAK